MEEAEVEEEVEAEAYMALFILWVFHIFSIIIINFYTANCLRKIN